MATRARKPASVKRALGKLEPSSTRVARSRSISDCTPVETFGCSLSGPDFQRLTSMPSWIEVAEPKRCMKLQPDQVAVLPGEERRFRTHDPPCSWTISQPGGR